MTMMKSGDWTAIGGCVRGASHVRSDMPCQDALRIENIERCYIVSVSDGHGSAACPYSDEGAKIAVDTAFSVFSSIFKGKGDPIHTISTNKDIWLPKQIEQNWKKTVQAVHDLKEREEIQDGTPFPYELYGATLLSLIATDEFVFALQLGDGDILSITDTNVDWVIPPDDNLGPETNSLCQDDCWQYMKTKILRLEPGGKSPMFMLSTDGYANSFYDNEGFKKAGADFYKLWNDESPGFIGDNLDGWLMESSAKGSGDDISLVLLRS